MFQDYCKKCRKSTTHIGDDVGQECQVCGHAVAHVEFPKGEFFEDIEERWSPYDSGRCDE